MNITHKPRSLLSRSIALALCVPAGAALAQTAAPAGSEAGENLETVIVSGVRASLGRAVEIKRGAGTVQDSISAVELGKFPDDNVADSLSHITGVAITRTAGGEGQKVSVRGLGPEYTLTTFDGRILATDGAGRDFAYDVLPSDVISGADVIKGAQASLPEGAIGGLVNLRSGSPFDQKGQQAIARFEGDRNSCPSSTATSSRAYSPTPLRKTPSVCCWAWFSPSARTAPTSPATTADGRATRTRTTRAGFGAMPGAATSIPTATATWMKTNMASSVPASSAWVRFSKRRSAARSMPSSSGVPAKTSGSWRTDSRRAWILHRWVTSSLTTRCLRRNAGRISPSRTASSPASRWTMRIRRCG